jgi:hypothetical protein
MSCSSNELRGCSTQGLSQLLRDLNDSNSRLFRKIVARQSSSPISTISLISDELPLIHIEPPQTRIAHPHNVRLRPVSPLTPLPSQDSAEALLQLRQTVDQQRVQAAPLPFSFFFLLNVLPPASPSPHHPPPNIPTARNRTQRFHPRLCRPTPGAQYQPITPLSFIP